MVCFHGYAKFINNILLFNNHVRDIWAKYIGLMYILNQDNYVKNILNKKI